MSQQGIKKLDSEGETCVEQIIGIYVTVNSFDFLQ